MHEHLGQEQRTFPKACEATSIRVGNLSLTLPVAAPPMAPVFAGGKLLGKRCCLEGEATVRTRGRPFEELFPEQPFQGLGVRLDA